ncbi:MAG: ATPase, T2SS/T4P/T4SS family [Aigarchaeota archaeon]|nr:ATPase, T2SS/T4P/T4SS family [Aigarchaeota archaeon]MCX8192653.1 ATPase, T2SS/T4P/T4SS family [Nitrososphaeria archaeon]MDW7985613.1 ATPase, T2SS/T4P/T4SS family [Nitrososphaerota archaeon]
MVEQALIDLSAIQLKVASHLVREGLLKGRLIIHRLLLSEIEKEASEGDTLAIEGLEDLERTCKSYNVEITYIGEIDEKLNNKRLGLIEEAKKLRATLVTCDPITAKLAQSIDVNVIYDLPPPPFNIDVLFSEDVMSIHLKEGLPPRVKKGIPGRWKLEEISDKPMNREDLELLIAHLMKEAYTSFGVDSFLEIDKSGVKIFQLRDYRIVVTRPPFSDGFELTVVRPILKKNLRDYNLPREVIERLEAHAEGILIAGPPGMGKSTFAQALAEHYRRMNKIVKTIESPRDLNVSPEITQYSKSASKENELHDVLLLSRPDYTIFDEIRGSEDFGLFIDLRYAGIGMVGVIHATTPIDAIQRIANKVDVGILPSIIDTVIFMDKGEVAEIYTLEIVVKVPAGLKKADLARPTVIVKDFLTNEPKYELYVFGERTFIVPVTGGKEEGSHHIKQISKVLSRYIPEYELEEDEETIRIYIPDRFYRTYLKKCQNKLLKIARKLEVRLEAIPKMSE